MKLKKLNVFRLYAFFLFSISYYIFAQEQQGTQQVLIFNKYIRYANQWVVITRSSIEQIQCPAGELLNTDYLGNLKPGLSICAEGPFSSREEAVDKKNKLVNAGGAYVKYCGPFIEKRALLAGNKASIFFSINLSDSVQLTCKELRVRADEVLKERGIDSSFIYHFETKKANKLINKDSLKAVDRSGFALYLLDKESVCLYTVSRDFGCTGISIFVWSKNGKLLTKESAYNEGDNESYEVSELKLHKGKWALVTRTKSSREDTEKTIVKYWNGRNFN